jgi:hypothetical protein
MKNLSYLSTFMLGIINYAANPETAKAAKKAWPNTMEELMVLFLILLGIGAIIAGVQWLIDQIK